MANRHQRRTAETGAVCSASDNEWPVNYETVSHSPYPKIFHALRRLGVEHLNGDDCSTLRRQFRAGISPSDLSSAFRVPVDVIDLIVSAR